MNYVEWLLFQPYKLQCAIFHSVVLNQLVAKFTFFYSFSLWNYEFQKYEMTNGHPMLHCLENNCQNSLSMWIWGFPIQNIYRRQLKLAFTRRRWITQLYNSVSFHKVIKRVLREHFTLWNELQKINKDAN